QAQVGPSVATSAPAATGSTAAATTVMASHGTEPTVQDGPDAPTTATAATSTSVAPNVPGVYAHAGVGQMSDAVAEAKRYVYVPSNDDGSVTVIDQATMQVVDEFHVGRLVQHVVADWDLRRLYATASDSNQLVPIDPVTGARTGAPIPVDAPYNLYFTPDGSTAVVMAERRNRIDYYDRTTWKLLRSIATGPCDGINHADWSADGSWFLATCEFSGGLIKVDTATGQIVDRLDLDTGAMPQDLRLAPDGTKFYVADMAHGCVWIIDATGTRVVGSIPTGVGAHGIYPSRDATRIYVSNRGRTESRNTGPSHDGQGSVSVIDPATDQVVGTWQIPGGGSPDMGGVSADGSRLWLSGRYDAEVYVFDTTTGELVGRIKVPPGPHGLNVFPQPGRYSLGHTGSYR
ncbi:MAG: beta-propeller repeat-containing protein, partial [Ilumatobacteraceae bacterium]|nr:beta-propeller repeat-containing protein [Ilumatobacteraceae bacterium]